MKPMTLKIKGLASFDEEQTIDFEKLTKGGLFGIFGPTGSGKSTILDAMTLALYDKISRYDGDKKARQFMNSNCSSLLVHFRFEFASTVYVAERSYKRKPKENNILPVSARLYAEKPEGNVPLADQGPKVSKEVEKLIGINYDDFTRSVILPQGKFSEFLHLANRDRRNMLERIFRLEEYGESLNKRILAASNIAKNKLTDVDSKLEVYGDLTEAQLNEEKDGLNLMVAELAKLKELQESDQNEFNIQKALREIYDEYLLAVSLRNRYQQNEEERLARKTRLQKAKRADIVKPLEIEAAQTKRKANDLEKQVDDKEKLLDKLTTEEDETRKKYDSVSALKEERIPLYSKMEVELEQAVRFQESLRKVEKEREELVEKLYSLRQERNRLGAEDEKNNAEHKRVREQREMLGLRRQEIDVSQHFRERIDEIYALWVRLEEGKSRITRVKKEVVRASAKYLSVVSEHEKIEEELQISNEKYQTLLKKCPCSADDLLEEQQKLMLAENEYKQNLKSYEKYIKFGLEKDVITKELDENTHTLKSVDLKLAEADKQSTITTEALDAIRYDNAVFTLAEGLTDNVPCPVCGSSEHPNPADKVEKVDTERSLQEAILTRDNAALLLERTRKEYQDISIANKELCLRLEVKVNDMTLLFSQLGEFDAETSKSALVSLKNEINAKEKSIADYDKSKKTLEIELQNKQIQFAKASEKVVSSKARKDETEADERNAQSECAELLRQIEEKCAPDIPVADIKLWRSKIQSFDQEREKLDKSETEYRQSSDKLDKAKEVLQSQILKNEQRISAVTTQGQEKRLMIDQLKDTLVALTKEPNPLDALSSIQNEKEQLLADFDNWTIKLATTVKTRQQQSEAVEGLKKQQEAVLEILENQNTKLVHAMKDNEFTSMEQVNMYLMDSLAQKELESEITEEEDAVRKAYVQAADFEKKLEGKDAKNASEKEMQLKEKIACRGEEINDLTKKIAVREERLVNMSKNLEIVNTLKTERKALVWRNDKLDDIARLFRGNTFVEFIARRQLKYISSEASIRLKEMTSNRYALELDGTDFVFVIRDDHNGGARRSPKTLSGGETFMVSLCLAFALSSKIQLKSSSSLDFFFLDEGFGTLDQAALDVVIDVLEKLRRDKTKVGIITHVEELKTRINAKLIVTPQEQGLHGSVVKLEN